MPLLTAPSLPALSPLLICASIPAPRLRLARKQTARSRDSQARIGNSLL
jgi:hypothetical protein